MASTKQKKRSISEVIRGFQAEDVQPKKSSKRILSKLARKIGILSRLGCLFPINIKWKQMDELSFEVFCDELEAEYDFQDHPKAWHFVIKSVHDKWKKWKYFVKKKYYDVYKDDEARLANQPQHVEEGQWVSLVRYWGTLEAQRISKQNSRNRKKKGDKRLQCLLGPISITQKEYKMRKEVPDVAYSVYKACYTKKDGTCLISSQMEDFDKLVETSQMQDKITASSFATLAPKVFGSEHGGYVRGVGLGVSKRALVIRSGLYRGTAAKKLADENKALKEQLEHSKKETDKKFEAQNRLIENLSSELQKLKQNGSNGHVATDSSGRSNSDA